MKWRRDLRLIVGAAWFSLALAEKLFTQNSERIANMERPTSATVFGILNIAFAAMGAFGVVLAVAMFSTTADANNPVIKIMRESPGYMIYMKIMIPLGAVACVLLLVAGIGLLCFKAWGRILSIVYAVWAILNGILGAVMNFFVLFLPRLHQAQQINGPEQAGAYGGAIGGTFGSCFGLIYPVLLLIFMLRPKLAAAFRGTTSQTGMP